MMILIKQTKGFLYLAILLPLFIASLAFAYVVPANAGVKNGPCATDMNKSSFCSEANVANHGNEDGVNKLLNTITDSLMFAVGVVGVAMVIVSGIRYITAHGDKSQITSAKNTLIYSLVGIVVAICAYGIVKFILDKFS